MERESARARELRDKGEEKKGNKSSKVMVDLYYNNQFSHIFISVHHGRSRASQKIIILSLTLILRLLLFAILFFSLKFPLEQESSANA